MKYPPLVAAITTFHQELATQLHTDADTIEYLRKSLLKGKMTPISIKTKLYEKNAILLTEFKRRNNPIIKKILLTKINKNIERIRLLNTLELEEYELLKKPKYFHL